jgi:hypothetical protein
MQQPSFTWRNELVIRSSTQKELDIISLPMFPTNADDNKINP